MAVGGKIIDFAEAAAKKVGRSANKVVDETVEAVSKATTKEMSQAAQATGPRVTRDIGRHQGRPAGRAPNEEIMALRQKLSEKYSKAIDGNVKNIIETDRKMFGSFRNGANLDDLERNVNRSNMLGNMIQEGGGVNSANSQYATRGQRNFSNEERAERFASKIKAEEKAMLDKEKLLNKNQGSIKDHNAKARQTEQAAKEASDGKKADSRKYFTNENIRKAVGLGVGGYVVMNMFDRGGQLSNAELYGQQTPYQN